MGFLVNPLLIDNICNVPHPRIINSNGINSRVIRLTDIWHATIDATILQAYRQLRPLSPPTPCQRPGPPSIPSRSSEDICERALMLSRLDGAHKAKHRSRGSASREMTPSLRLAVDHTTKHALWSRSGVNGAVN